MLALRGTTLASIALTLAVASLVVCVPASANLTTSAQAVAWLNAQREANGIPGGITDDPEWNVACQHHVTWLKDNASRASAEEQHQEVSGTPGYTTDGEWAGLHSVLDETFWPVGSSGADTSPENLAYPWGALNGWEWAPLHLMGLLKPELATTGFYPGCMVTYGGTRPGPATPQLLTYPGPNTSFIYPIERAFEIPFTPGEFVGIRKRGLAPPPTTGPYLLVFASGDAPGRITAAWLRGPSGSVPVATVDDETTGPLGDLGAYLPPGGIVIPLKPLKPLSGYTASVTFEPQGPSAVALTDTWHFSTGLLPNRLETARVYIEPKRRHRAIARILPSSTAPNLIVKFTGPHGKVVYAHPDPHSNELIAILTTTGLWEACTASGGPPTQYASVRYCETLKVVR